jgi:DNA (cytosine-5)-methyltransferase 1
MARRFAYYNENDPQKAVWIRELIKAGVITDGEVDERSIEDVLPSELARFARCHFFAGIAIWDYALRCAGWPDDRAVWTGSCPCQPFSAAGKGEGFADERHLWPAWYHLISIGRPDVLFGEQVASKDGLAWLDIVCDDLEAAGYAVGAIDLCAAGFGAPHIRQRLFLVADTENERHERQRRTRRRRHGLENNGSAGELADANGRYASTEGLQRSGQQRQLTQDGGAANGLGDTGSQGLERRESEPGDDGQERATAERAGGATGGFWSDAEWICCRDGKHRPTQPGIFPLVNGAPARMVRLRGYGDGIVAPAAEAFIRAYMELDQS